MELKKEAIGSYHESDGCGGGNEGSDGGGDGGGSGGGGGCGGGEEGCVGSGGAGCYCSPESDDWCDCEGIASIPCIRVNPWGLKMHFKFGGAFPYVSR